MVKTIQETCSMKYALHGLCSQFFCRRRRRHRRDFRRLKS